MNILERLQRWYESHCDGEWEHSYGVSITTLDNPGWLVQVDLTGTALESVSFAAVRRGDSEGGGDWIVCKRDGAKFVGAGGGGNLEEVITRFLSWAEAPPASGT